MISRSGQSRSIFLGLLLLGLLTGCASLPGPVERAEQWAVPVTGDSSFDRTIAEFLAPYPGQSAAHFLEDGLDAFAARLLAADRASRSIDAQYYLFHDDVTGRLYAERLLRAAKRGVKVRLLLDDMGAHRMNSSLLWIIILILIFEYSIPSRIERSALLSIFTGLVWSPAVCTTSRWSLTVWWRLREDEISGMIISTRAQSPISLIWTSCYSGPQSIR